MGAREWRDLRGEVITCFCVKLRYILTSSSLLKRNWGIATKTRFFILVYKAGVDRSANLDSTCVGK